MQVVDSLQVGGLESVAVNLANSLSGLGFKSYLCATRSGGPLERRLRPEVERLDLGRRGLLDLGAIWRLARWVQRRQIQLIHAHGSALFFSALVHVLVPGRQLIWHDHFGRYGSEERPGWIYRMAARRCRGVMAVNEPLAEWARSRLKVPPERVWYVPNFVAEPPGTAPQRGDLPGTGGRRIVCVANLRPEKDHATLIEAMKQVSEAAPEASLLLVGDETNQPLALKLREQIQQQGLDERVFLLGSRPDVWAVLRACNIGVLASASEGMPLALLEYGCAGLAVAATAVGQVPDILDHGRAGLLVPPRQPAALAQAMLQLLQSPQLRSTLAAALQCRVRQHYSQQAVLRQVTGIYETLLDG